MFKWIGNIIGYIIKKVIVNLITIAIIVAVAYFFISKMF